MTSVEGWSPEVEYRPQNNETQWNGTESSQKEVLLEDEEDLSHHRALWDTIGKWRRC